MKKLIKKLVVTSTSMVMITGLLLLASCSPEQSTPAINGKWVSSVGTGIEISGSTGVFYDFSSSWQEFADAGFVTIGSLNLKNISKINSSEWNCDVLWMKRIDGIPTSIQWATDGIIVWSSSLNTITISATLDSGPASATYNKVL